MVEYRNEPLGWTAAQIIEVDLRDLAGENIRSSVPAQYVTFKF